MRRRDFIALGGGIFAGSSLAASAQQTISPRRIGLLAFGQGPDGSMSKVIREELSKLGLNDDRRFLFEFRSAQGDPERLQRAAAELSQIPVDVMVTDSGAASLAAAKATSTIPIVMGVISDPVSLGLVTSLAHPGRNVTGFSIISPELGTKRLALLSEALPGARRIGILVNPGSPVTGAQQLASITSAAAALGLSIVVGEARTVQEISKAIEHLAADHASAILTVGDPVFFQNRRTIVEQAAGKNLPGMYPEREYVDAGGLLAYGPSIPANFRRAAR